MPQYTAFALFYVPVVPLIQLPLHLGVGNVFYRTEKLSALSVWRTQVVSFVVDKRFVGLVGICFALLFSCKTHLCRVSHKVKYRASFLFGGGGLVGQLSYVGK